MCLTPPYDNRQENRVTTCGSVQRRAAPIGGARLSACLVAALTALLLLPTSASAGVEQTTTRYSVDSLRADWILPTGSDDVLRYLVVHVYRRTNLDTGEVSFSAVSGRGLCPVGRGEVFGCGVNLQPFEVVSFEADPAFATAAVVLRRGRVRQSVKFVTSAPYAYVPPVGQTPSHLCDNGVITTVYVAAKNANAEGRVFGRDVATTDETPGHAESEKMIQTVEIVECP